MREISLGADTPASRRQRRGEPQATPPVDPAGILTSLGFLAYHWNIGSGALAFAGDPLCVFQGEWGHRFENVARLEEGHLSPARGLRQAALFGEERLDDGSGVPYALSYRLRSRDGRLFFVEESGRWFAGLPGHPMSARGLLKVHSLGNEQRDVVAPGAGTGSASGEEALREALQRAAQLAQRSRRGFALLAAAIGDDFDGEGSAARLRRVMRRGDSLMRIDAEMSLCILNACDDAQLATAIKRLETAFADPDAAPGEPAAHHALVGATWKGSHANAETLAASVIGKARAQLAARTVAAHIGDAAETAERRRVADWPAEILQALNERRLALAYQPIVHARSRRVAFHEGLLRLRGRSGRPVPASLFIEASEEHGLVTLLDQRVIELAVQELRRRPGLKLAINASAISLASPDWLASLRSHAGNGEVGRRLIVEVTETAAIADMARTRDVLAAVKALGIMVAIDDFGTGHTSFRALRELPIDIIKIDGTFVQDIDRSSDGRFFICTLVELARRLGCRVVGEWVESEAAARIVEKLGVDYLQGRLIGAPRLQSRNRRVGERRRNAA